MYLLISRLFKCLYIVISEPPYKPCEEMVVIVTTRVNWLVLTIDYTWFWWVLAVEDIHPAACFFCRLE